jgi:hypothetical protein
MNGRLMPGDQLAERGVISLSGPGDQLGVGHVVYRHPGGRLRLGDGLREDEFVSDRRRRR